MEFAQLVQIVCSAVLFLIVWACFRRVLEPFLANLEERQARTFGDEQASGDMRQKIRVLDAEIEELLRQARQEGASARDARVNAAKQEAQRLLEQAEAWASSEIEKGETAVAQIKERALLEVSNESEKLARLVVERALSSGGSAVVH